MNKKGALSILQILILIIGIFSISYIIGSETKIISAVTSAEMEKAGWILDKGLWTKEGAESIPDSEIGKIIFKGKGGSSGASSAGVATPSVANIPTSHDSYAGRLIEKIFPGSTAGAGTKIYDPATGKLIGTSQGLGYSAAGIVQAAYHAVLVYGIVALVGGFLGLESNIVSAASTAAAWGVFVGKSALSILGPGGYLGGAQGLITGLGATGIGLAVAVVVYVMVYSNVKIKIITFTCDTWDSETGGKNCEKCNKQGDLPCSEYQCRSLGQSCELLNPGTNDEKCIWVNPQDVKHPIITPNSDVLPSGYKYTPDNAISPPDRGVKIINGNSNENCVKPFEEFTFGITLDEPAKCKIDYLRKNSFEDMEFYFGGNSLLKYNHTQRMNLPGIDNLAEENITLKNGGQFELYTRCQDSNGNSNTANFVFKFCVEEGPDTTPPLIVTTSLLNGMPIGYDETSIDLEVYVNEPADCKWSHLDTSYDKMENEMSCSSSITEMNAQSLYTCSTTLTGLKNNFENEFYFRCKDQPMKTSDRNVNSESYKFTLIGTQPLVIDEVEPNNETIKDSTDAVQVTLKAKTSAGYKEGESSCFYGDGEESNYVMFYETHSHYHSQDLWLGAGEYNYFIKCIDLGGNSDIEEINFVVESDNEAPLVVRAYNDEPYLKLITNEEAECVYDVVDCSYLFEDGTSITSSDGFDHFTDWNTKTNLYIKCKDKYGNSPQPQNICSIEVRAF